MKLSSLPLRRQIARWVYPTASISSISSAQESDHKPSIGNDVEPKIHSLKNRLAPDSLIKVLDGTADLASAVKIFKWASSQRRFHHNADTYSSIILKLGMGGCGDEMEGFCRELVRDECPYGEGALVSVMGRFVEHGRLSEAKRVFAAMVAGGCKPSLDTANVLLGALVDGKRELVEVLYVYKEMVKAGTLPNVDTLNYLIEALCDAGRLDLALEQYKRMGRKGSVPNPVTYRILISSFIAKGNVVDSTVILNEMLSSGCDLDIGFCASVVPLFARLNKVNEAMRVFRRMRDSNIEADLGIYEVLLQCLVENLWLDDAAALSHEMMEKGMAIPENVAEDIVNGFCDLGRLDEARNFVEDNSLSDVSVHDALLEGYCKVEYFCEAVQLFESMFQRRLVDNLSWNVLVRFLADMGMTRKAKELVSRMIVASFVPDSATYCGLIVGNCQTFRYGESFKLYLLMRKKNWVLDLNSYAVLVEGLCEAEMILEATEVFYYMSGERCALESSSLNVLLCRLCAANKVDEAIKLRASSYHSGTGWNSIAYDTIMQTLLEQKMASEVLQVFSLMLAEGVSPSVRAYSLLLQSMVLQDRPEKCASLFTRMVGDGLIPDSETLSKLISCLVNHGQLHTISGIIDCIISRGDFLNSAIFNMLVRGLLKEGYKSKACQLLDLMLGKGWVPDAQTHAMLIGSDANQDGSEKTTACLNGSGPDSVDSILLDGLG
uniref:Pentatricopeptide repeat-containing protein n=1 Tax=Kalanchoe fedtschenkoi TaxID=63787 RepID=A0A7N0U7V6_KALFE